MSSAKAEALALIQKLPDDATWETVLYRVYLRAKIEQGMADVAAGRVFTHEQVMQGMEDWLASLGRSLPEEIPDGSGPTGSLGR